VAVGLQSDRSPRNRRAQETAPTSHLPRGSGDGGARFEQENSTENSDGFGRAVTGEGHNVFTMTTPSSYSSAQ
jgi:hypothetical protein